MIKKKNQEKKKRLYSIISGLVLVFLMVFSIIALSFSNNDAGDGLVYNNYTFKVKEIYDQQLFFSNIYKYYAVVDGREIQTYFSPLTVSTSLDSEVPVRDIYDSQILFFVIQPLAEDDFSANVLFKNALIFDVSRFSGKRVIKGLTSESMFLNDPVIGCNDAVPGSLVFILSENTSGVNIRELDYNCYEILASGENYLLASDYLILSANNILI